MEVKIAKPGKNLTILLYWVANVKLDELNTEFKTENEKKNLNYCNIRYSLNVKKNSFVKSEKNNTLKKLKHREILKPEFKLIIDFCKNKLSYVSSPLETILQLLVFA